MKKLIASTALISTFIGPAFAGNPEVVVYEAPEVVAVTQTTDWSGAYVGGMVNFASGVFEYTSGRIQLTRPYDLEDTTQFGGFGGYNFQRGNVVFGAEAAYTTGRMPELGGPEYGYDWFADLKGRVGFAAGDALVYGFGGATWSEYDNSGELVPQNGFNFGAGVDYQLSETLFAGVEYIQRDVSHVNSEGNTYSGDIQAIQLRVGLSF